MSCLSSHLASSVSLASTFASSNSDDFYSCDDEMATDEYPPEQIPSSEANLEELNFPLEADAEDQPFTVLIHSAVTSLIASPNPFLSSPPPLPLVSSLTIE